MLYAWKQGAGAQVIDFNEFAKLVKTPGYVLWLDLENSGSNLRNDLESLTILHPISIERIFTQQPRAFLDEYDDYLHLLLQEIVYDQGNEVVLNECHCIIGSNYLITCHRRPLAAIDELKKTTPPNRFFSEGPDLLFYYIAGPIISTGYAVLDSIADLTEALEDKLFPEPDRRMLNEIFNLKRDLINIRRALAAMREVFSRISRRENPFVDSQALPFMGHLYDQIIRLHEISDTQREIISGALEIYLSSQSNRMNEIMKTLTIVSTFILPLTLLVGYYGMNFRFFPELEWKYGIYYFIALMLAIILIMVWFFKRKKWF